MLLTVVLKLYRYGSGRVETSLELELKFAPVSRTEMMLSDLETNDLLSRELHQMFPEQDRIG